MARNVTQYELLISCPSDVSDELDIIKETVEDFNRMYGAANNASITTKHWSKDSYPQSGGKPQELLNNQFVRDCDAAVAVFWTRFGTPTDKYGSGTEEEIEELINSNKQVFLYFSDRQINPSSINNSQYEKVQTFRKKYGDKSIYATYSDLDQFKKIFLNHLSLHFVDIFNNGEDKDSNTQSSLSINGVKKGKITEQPYALQADFLNTGFVHNMKNNIMKKIKEVEHLNFPKVSYQDETIEENEYPLKKSSIIDQGISSKLSKQLKQAKVSPSLFETEEVYIGDFEKKSINKFALENSLEIDESNFFNLGSLCKQKSLLGGGPFGTKPSYSFVGSDEEKNKHNLIEEIYQEIVEYDQWVAYFTELEEKDYLNLCLSNSGTHYDEDVDVGASTSLCK